MQNYIRYNFLIFSSFLPESGSELAVDWSKKYIQIWHHSGLPDHDTVPKLLALL